MRIVGSERPEFYVAASVIRKWLPLVQITEDNKIIYDKGRYYGIITVDGTNLGYDHVCLDPLWMTPTHVCMVLDTVFKLGLVINSFVDPKNTRSKRFLKGVGFTNTGTLRQADGNWEIWSMTVKEWQNNRIRRHFINMQKQTPNK